MPQWHRWSLNAWKHCLFCLKQFLTSLFSLKYSLIFLKYFLISLKNFLNFLKYPLNIFLVSLLFMILSSTLITASDLSSALSMLEDSFDDRSQIDIKNRYYRLNSLINIEDPRSWILYRRILNTEIARRSRDLRLLRRQPVKTLRVRQHPPKSFLAPHCHYPNPFLKHQVAECSTYVGVSYICDPDGMMSRTEAEAIDQLVSMRFHSCGCLLSDSCNQATSSEHRQSFQHMFSVNSRQHFAEINVGVALLRQGAALFSLDDMLKQCPSLMDFRTFVNLWDVPVIRQSYYLHPKAAGQAYAEIIRQLWSRDGPCTTDVLVLVVSEWTDKRGQRLLEVSPYVTIPENQFDRSDGYHFSSSHLFVSIGERLREKLALTESGLANLTSAVEKAQQSALSSSANAAAIMQFLRNLSRLLASTQATNAFDTRALKDSIKEQRRALAISCVNCSVTHRIPLWAWVCFGVCALLIVSSTLTGVCINTAPRMRSTALASSGNPIRLTNQRWRAGFGGGMIPQGYKFGGGRSAPLMFKQFTTSHYSTSRVSTLL